MGFSADTLNNLAQLMTERGAANVIEQRRSEIDRLASQLRKIREV